MVLSEVMELEDGVGYPFRASLEKKARCFYCKHYMGTYNPDDCTKGHQLIFPLVTNEHHCKDYEYKKIEIKFKAPAHPECSVCAFWYFGCSGVKWIPYKNYPECEFLYHKDKVCKNAIPMLQYGCQTRNNYCKLPPHKRDGDASRGWKWLCPNAHTPNITNMKCYKPKVSHSTVENENEGL